MNAKIRSRVPDFWDRANSRVGGSSQNRLRKRAERRLSRFNNSKKMPLTEMTLSAAFIFGTFVPPSYAGGSAYFETVSGVSFLKPTMRLAQ